MRKLSTRMNLNSSRALSCALFASFALAVPARLDDKDLLDKMVLNPNLKTFVNLLARAEMMELIKADGPYTVFAPSNAAFAKLPAAQFATLTKDKAILKKFLTYQMVEGRLLSKDLKDGNVKSIEGGNLAILTKPVLRLNKGKIVAIDDLTSNGVIYVVDTVSIPPSLMPKTATEKK